jgi:3'-phosphoadenosine 5'-phosphosulfate sulfotransferase (PAPS reductase)/FAD synthetase
MTDFLFTAAEVYNGDPLNPDMEAPTPAEVVGKLSPRQRRVRLINLEDQARRIYTNALTAHLGARRLVASCVLFSGGNDSTTLAHMFRDTATHAIHANTTIGIEQTRQFVRDTCAGWGLSLIEKRAPVSYRELVLEQGFPGPAMHWKMYQRLKERALDAARHDLGVANSRSRAAVFIAGRRRAESERREDVPLHESDGSVIWVSPLAMWTKLDLNTYREMHPDVPRNEVADLLHMSGECLCGAFAKPGEIDAIGQWFPEVRAEIEQLQADVAAAGHAAPLCRWGHGVTGAGLAAMKTGRLCTSCQIPGQLDLLDSA